MTVKIYGPTASRAARALWIVHELGIPFEHVAMEMKDLKNADYLKDHGMQNRSDIKTAASKSERLGSRYSRAARRRGVAGSRGTG